MKHIVLYTMVMITGLLMAFPAAIAQKPAIDLLPSTQLRVHPEAMVDTSFSTDSLVNFIPDNQPSYSDKENKEKRSFWKKESRRPGLQLESLFQKQVSSKDRQRKNLTKYPLILKFINPMKFFIHIPH